MSGGRYGGAELAAVTADEIQATRRGLGLTVSEIARAAAVGPDTWRGWERGAQTPTAASWARVGVVAIAYRAAVARYTARLLSRPHEPIPVDDHPAALAAAGAAILLAGTGGRIRVQCEAPPTPATE